MGRPPKKKKTTTTTTEGNLANINSGRISRSCSSTPIFEALISTIQSPQGLKLPTLKTLYYLVTSLSTNGTVKSTNWENALNYGDMECKLFGCTVTFNEICVISDILHNELDSRFKQLFIALQDVSASKLHGQAGLYSNIWPSIDELMLLLRCRMVILTLLRFDQIVEKGCDLLSIISRLISVEFSGGNRKNNSSLEMTVSDGYTQFDDGCSAPVASSCTSDPRRTYLSALLQVVADELLMHRPLRKYFMLIDDASFTSDKLFMYHFGYDHIGIVLEVIAAQFIEIFSDEQESESSVSRLFWQLSEDYRISQMSLNASLSLLLCPLVVSAPKMFQAYVFSSVSEAIGIVICPEGIKRDRKTMEYYLTAFERSIMFYTKSMSYLHEDGLSTVNNGSNVRSGMLGSSQLDFESYLHPATISKIYHLVNKFNSALNSCTSNISHRTKLDLVDASIDYVRNLHVFDEDNKDKFFSVLDFIIRWCACDDICNTVMYKEAGSPQDMYLLASILMLMSSSMLQAICCLRHGSSSGCLKSLQDSSLCKGYDFMVHLMGQFQQINFTLPIQKFLSDTIEAESTHKELRWMLLHILGLLSLSYVRGLDFLVKDCLFTMMCLLNFWAFVEGSLDTVSSLFCSGMGTLSSELFENELQASVKRESCKLAALKFQKIRMMYLSKRRLASLRPRNRDKQSPTPTNASPMNHIEPPSDIEEEVEEARTGEMFLECMLGNSTRPPDFDDLADFIECNPRKDYSIWLKDREKYRKRKCKRRAISTRKKRKKR